MPDLAKLVLAIAALVVAVTTIGSAVIWLVWPRFMGAIRQELKPTKDQVETIHKQVTENHHSNEQPTLLDLLDDFRSELRAGIASVDKKIDDHLVAASHADADMWRAIEAVAKGQPPEDL